MIDSSKNSAPTCTTFDQQKQVTSFMRRMVENRYKNSEDKRTDFRSGRTVKEAKEESASQ